MTAAGHGGKFVRLTVYKTSRDKPFSLSAEDEERLVGRGVAEYVTAQPTNAGAVIQPDDPGEEKPEYSVALNVTVLRDLMKAVGLKTPVGMTKAAMVAALDEFYGVAPDGEDSEDEDGEDGDEEDGELPPVGAADPVTI